jgi:hypothetical protein
MKSVIAKIQSNADTRIILLRLPEVVHWLFGDTSFLPQIEKKNKSTDTKECKLLEDAWGITLLEKIRPDLVKRNGNVIEKKQWTGPVGEHLCKELYLLQGKEICKPKKQQHFQPDLETDDAVLEVKTQTFFTTGTAGEKIFGVPFKYADVPGLYGKPLHIICLAGAEKMCRDNGMIGPCSAEKQKCIDLYRDGHIEFVAASDILRAL